MEKWMERMSCRINLPGSFQARFFTLYRDGRDTMSDSLAPSWEPTSQHRIYVYDTSTQYSSLDPVLSLNVSKAAGNHLYERLKAIQTAEGTADYLDWLKAIITRNGTINHNIGIWGDIKDIKEVTTCNA